MVSGHSGVPGPPAPRRVEGEPGPGPAPVLLQPQAVVEMLVPALSSMMARQARHAALTAAVS